MTGPQVPGQLELPIVAVLSARQRADLGQWVARDWRDRAACAGQNVDEFYPDAPVTRLADPKDACAFCPVARSCLAVALLHDEQGVWGRTDETDRDEIRAELTRGGPAWSVLDGVLSGPINEWSKAS